MFVCVCVSVPQCLCVSVFVLVSVSAQCLCVCVCMNTAVATGALPVEEEARPPRSLDARKVFCVRLSTTTHKLAHPPSPTCLTMIAVPAHMHHGARHHTEPPVTTFGMFLDF